MSARSVLRVCLGVAGAAAALAAPVAAWRRVRAGERGGVLVATRIHLPEAAAASFRLDGVERALAARRVPVRVLTTRPPADVEHADGEAQGVRVSRWPALRDSSGYLRGYVPYLSFDLPLALRLLLAPRPGVVLVEPPPTTGAVVRVVAALRGVPYVWYAPDVWSTATLSTGAPGPVVRAVRALEAFAVRGAARVIAVNDEVARAVSGLARGGAARSDGAAAAVPQSVRRENVRVVPNGVDTTVFDVLGPRPDPRERAGMGLTGHYFVYAGTASEWQGAEVFVHALEQVRRTRPGVQLLFLGQGSAWHEIERAASRLPAGPDGAPAVVMHPLVPAAEAARWQRAAVAALVSIRPGQGYDFAYPTKVLSALGCGTPVLYAGRGPVVADIRDFDLGWAAEHEPAAVARAMRAALDAHGTGSAERAAAQRLHDWVEDHRSLRATGESVGRILHEVAAGAARVGGPHPIHEGRQW